MPIQPLQNLHQNPTPQEIIKAVEPILDYLENDNPYFFAYRFGPKQGEGMKLGLQELKRLAAWALENAFDLHITPIRRYYRIDQETEVVQAKQTKFEDWM
jgi:hypothetical protein